jgi:hypothetical protein
MKIAIITHIAIILGYSYDVHRFLSNDLKHKLSDETYNKVLDTFSPTSLNDASVWSDRVKRWPGYAWTSKLHYMNINECSKTNDVTCNNCIVDALVKFIESFVLKIPNRNLSVKETLMMILHLSQDITQPLHVFGINRGGNDINIIRNKNGRNRTMTLHALFDDEIPQEYIKEQLTQVQPFNPRQIPLTNGNSREYFQDPLDKIKETLSFIVNWNVEVSCNYIYKQLPGSFPVTNENGTVSNFTYIVFEDYYKDYIVKGMFDNYTMLIKEILEYIF